MCKLELATHIYLVSNVYLQACSQLHKNLFVQVPMKTLQILAVLVTLCHANHTEYFVKPNDSVPCPGLPCHTLSHYMDNTTLYFASNTRISLLPGVHEADKSPGLCIENASNFIVTGYNVSSSHAAKIVCMKPATLVFLKVVNLVVNNCL